MRWLAKRRARRAAESAAREQRERDAWMAFWAAMHHAQRAAVEHRSRQEADGGASS